MSLLNLVKAGLTLYKIRRLEMENVKILKKLHDLARTGEPLTKEEQSDLEAGKNCQHITLFGEPVQNTYRRTVKYTIYIDAAGKYKFIFWYKSYRSVNLSHTHVNEIKVKNYIDRVLNNCKTLNDLI